MSNTEYFLFLTVYKQSKCNASTFAICSRESDAQSDYSLFEALRDSIYAEVATLISQNESRPHFLVSTFTI